MAGLRSMSPLALLSYDATRNNRHLDGSVFAPIATPRALTLLRFASLGEIIVDKLPFVPSRTKPAPLFGRAVLGATAGAIVFTEEELSPLAGAALGGAAAIASSFAGYGFRSALINKIHLPNVLSGLVEDGVLAAIGLRILNI